MTEQTMTKVENYNFIESKPKGEEKLKPEKKSSGLSCLRGGCRSVLMTGLLKLELRLTSSYLYGLVERDEPDLSD